MFVSTQSFIHDFLNLIKIKASVSSNLEVLEKPSDGIRLLNENHTAEFQMLHFPPKLY